MPGCRAPWSTTDPIADITDRIHWRFCGGFFWGDVASLETLYALYTEALPLFLETYGTLVWEVNLWAWLEGSSTWRPRWYLADHDDSLIRVPTDPLAICVAHVPSTTARPVTTTTELVDTWWPSSTSFWMYRGPPVLNVRHVNYTITPEGAFIIHDPHGTIRTKNVCQRLDDDLATVVDEFEMADPDPVPYTHHQFDGLEDLRIYESGGLLRFIASSTHYTADGRIAMVVGLYHLGKRRLSAVQPIHSPTDAHCEKNWVPITYRGQEAFIYGWSPMQIGVVHPDTRRLEIRVTWPAPVLAGCRGSSVFVDYRGKKVGVVHFSEGWAPRHYFHRLVALDPDTLQPCEVTPPFYFDRGGIEFCIGFAVRPASETYVFWVSQFDRDPVRIEVGTDALPFDPVTA
jgi:hypothetical protein